MWSCLLSHSPSDMEGRQLGSVWQWLEKQLWAEAPLCLLPALRPGHYLPKALASCCIKRGWTGQVPQPPLAPHTGSSRARVVCRFCLTETGLWLCAQKGRSLTQVEAQGKGVTLTVQSVNQQVEIWSGRTKQKKGSNLLFSSLVWNSDKNTHLPSQIK